MIKFRYFYDGVLHCGFARQFTKEDKSRYLIILKEGLSLVVTSTNNHFQENKLVWLQVPKGNEMIQADDLIQAIGAGLQNGELI